MFTFRGPRYETVLTQKQDLPAGARLPDLLRGVQASYRTARRGSTILRATSLRMLFEDVEVGRKRARARLPAASGRALREAFVEAPPAVTGLDFRWQVARRLMTDVYEGLHG